MYANVYGKEKNKQSLLLVLCNNMRLTLGVPRYITTGKLIDFYKKMDIQMFHIVAYYRAEVYFTLGITQTVSWSLTLGSSK